MFRNYRLPDTTATTKKKVLPAVIILILLLIGVYILATSRQDPSGSYNDPSTRVHVPAPRVLPDSKDKQHKILKSEDTARVFSGVRTRVFLQGVVKFREFSPNSSSRRLSARLQPWPKKWEVLYKRRSSNLQDSSTDGQGSGTQESFSGADLV